jgi:hypothetical protein
MDTSIKIASLHIINQLIDFLEQLPQHLYTTPLLLLSDSTIGKHTRHIIEFYECVLFSANTGTVNYDARTRDIHLETDKLFCIDKLHHLANFIGKINGDTPLKLQMSLSATEAPVQTETSFFRELMYTMEHAIHHMAIIRIAIKSTNSSIELPVSFGVAFSTLQYQASACPAKFSHN